MGFRTIYIAAATYTCLQAHKHAHAKETHRMTEPTNKITLPFFTATVWHGKDGRAHIEVPARAKNWFPAGTEVVVKAVMGD